MKKVFVLILGLALVGCNDPQIKEDVKNYEDVLEQIEDINNKLQSGEITSEDAEILYEGVEEQVQITKEKTDSATNSSGR